MWQWWVCCLCKSYRSIYYVLYIEWNNVVSYIPSCEVIHFLNYCGSYGIDHYYIYVASPHIFLQHSIIIPAAGQWSYSVWSPMCNTIHQAIDDIIIYDRLTCTMNVAVNLLPQGVVIFLCRCWFFIYYSSCWCVVNMLQVCSVYHWLQHIQHMVHSLWYTIIACMYIWWRSITM